MKQVTVILMLCYFWGLTPAIAQSVAPTLDVGFALAFGCNELAESDGVHSVGVTSCDNPAATNFDGLDFDWSGDVGSYYLSFCGLRNGDGTYFPFGEPILPYSGSSDCSWIVGGDNYIYHNGTFFDGSEGLPTLWYKVITNAKGDAFVLGNTSGGLILAKFRGFDNTRILTRAGIGGSAMTRDKGGNLYVASGNHVTKYAPDASKVVYSTSIANTNINSIAVDAFGQLYITGTTEGGLSVVNAPQPQLGGATDGFIAVLSPKGNRIEYSSYLGGKGNETATGISVDKDGNAYIAGTDLSYAWDGRPDPCDSGDANCSEMYYVAAFGPFHNSSLPTKVAFGRRQVGTTIAKKVLFKNTGNVPVSVSEIQISGGEYAQTNTCTVSVKPDKTCAITLFFTPLSQGEHDGTMVVTSSSLSSPQQTVLTGAGK
jgi:hypothetical protein